MRNGKLAVMPGAAPSGTRGLTATRFHLGETGWQVMMGRLDGP